MSGLEGPRVSVLLLTYNHAPFVEQAILSAVTQRTSFPFEVVVGDDCSTDQTPRIVRRLAERFPGRVRPQLGATNLGMWGNFRRTLNACRGEYVALLEGDDYWTAADKLERQVELLTSQKTLAMCFHQTIALTMGGGREVRGYTKARATTADLLARNFMMTASVMIRRTALESLPGWLGRAQMLDWPVFVLASRHGDIGYIDEPMAVYRIHPGGVWSRRSKVEQLAAGIGVYEWLRAELSPSVESARRAGLSRRHFDLAWALADVGERRRALRHAAHALRAAIRNPLIPSREWARLVVFMLSRRAYSQASR